MTYFDLCIHYVELFMCFLRQFMQIDHHLFILVLFIIVAFRPVPTHVFFCDIYSPVPKFVFVFRLGT